MRDARVPVANEFKDPVRCYGVWGKDMGILYSLKGISLKGKKDKKITIWFQLMVKKERL